MKSIYLKISAILCLMFCGLASAKQITLNIAPGTPVVKAGQPQTAYVKVSVIGFDLQTETQRPPANISIVLDRSGSMAGEKIVRAKEAAIMAINSLGPNDIASIVTFDSIVEVIVPSTKVTDKTAIAREIEKIYPRGSTALFAGVSKGSQEVRKFLDKSRVNRVILLSDGQANLGPSSPSDLGRLGESLGRENISVTTIGLGLGYNEDLMAQLAGFSDGNHAFAENAHDLARIFNSELGDVSAVVAQDVDITIHIAPGVRPIRMLGREAEIAGQTVRTRMNQLNGGQEKFVILEVEVPAKKSGEELKLASVDVNYLNMHTRAKENLSRSTQISYTESEEKVTAATDKKVMSSAVEQVANTMSKQAIKLRDEGKVEEAKKVLNESADYLRSNASKLDAPALKEREQEVRKDAAEISNQNEWNKQRKGLTSKQYKIEKQQSY